MLSIKFCIYINPENKREFKVDLLQWIISKVKELIEKHKEYNLPICLFNQISLFSIELSRDWLLKRYALTSIFEQYFPLIYDIKSAFKQGDNYYSQIVAKKVQLYNNQALMQSMKMKHYCKQNIGLELYKIIFKN